MLAESIAPVAHDEPGETASGDGLTGIMFTTTGVGTPEQLEANVRSSMARGLPLAIDAAGTEVRTRPLCVLASGPSLNRADGFQVFKGDTLAINGALLALNALRISPTYWAACDPQEMVADFIPDDPPTSTTYFVASKCHPKVFDKLKDRKVVLWHVQDDLPALEGEMVIHSLSSITLCAIMLFNALGYSRFETWGWDGCYMDGKHHASVQPHDGERDKTVVIGDRWFRSTPTWASEAEQAVGLVETLRGIGVDVKIHGGGLIGALVDFRLGANG